MLVSVRSLKVDSVAHLEGAVDRLYTLNLETDLFTLSSGNVSELSPKLLIVVISSKPPPNYP